MYGLVSSLDLWLVDRGNCDEQKCLGAILMVNYATPILYWGDACVPVVGNN